MNLATACYKSTVSESSRLVEALPKTLVYRRIGDQLLRSSISVGANYEESRAAESEMDFIHKLQIALKELRESNYWLRLLRKSAKLPPQCLDSIINESNQLRAILSKAVATAKGKSKVKAATEPESAQHLTFDI